jgi:25S rRNA (adenine2142-N1)-methyltransferase
MLRGLVTRALVRCCAQVLTCVPDALSRGAMLRGMRAHLRAGGLLFVMLPLRCLTHSPFNTHARFAEALAAAGFEVRALCCE